MNDLLVIPHLLKIPKYKSLSSRHKLVKYRLKKSHMFKVDLIEDTVDYEYLCDDELDEELLLQLDALMLRSLNLYLF